MNGTQWAVAVIGVITLVGAIGKSKGPGDMIWVVGILVTVFWALLAVGQ